MNSIALIATILWVSAPVKPGDQVLVEGADFGKDPVVEVNGVRVRPTRVNDTSVVFTYPKTLDLLKATQCRILAADGSCTGTFALNVAEPWWVQPGETGVAAPGETIRIFGNALDFGNRARVRLANEGELEVVKRDTYELQAKLPEGLADGAYSVEVQNGIGGAAWKPAGEIAVGRRAWPWEGKRTYDPVSFGAIGNDEFDDTQEIQAALDAAGKAGGGVVSLPRGRFIANAKLVIPPRVCLRGASRDLTQIYWIDTEEPPDALIEGSTDFALTDIFLHCGKYAGGIICSNRFARTGPFTNKAGMEPYPSKNVVLRNVTLRPIIDQYIRRDAKGWIDRLFTPGNAVEIRFVDNLVVENCDLLATKSDTWVYGLSGRNVRIRNNRFDGSCHSWAPVTGEMIVYEGNTATGMTYGLAPATRKIFFSRNTAYRQEGGDREGMTQDGGRTAFRDGKGKGYTCPAACTGTKIVFDLGPLKGLWFGRDFWKGYQVQIVEGRGVGQTRTIVGVLSESEMTLDEPWTVAPDTTSRFTVVGERRYELFLDNVFTETSCALQLYGGSTDAILARNRSVAAGGFIAHGMQYAAALTMWRVQMLDNVIEVGNGLRGPQNEIPTVDSKLTIANSTKPLLVRDAIMRGNVIRNNGLLVMDAVNAVVERNTVCDSDTGLDAEKNLCCESLVVGDNAFVNVGRPYSGQVARRAVFVGERPRVQDEPVVRRFGFLPKTWTVTTSSGSKTLTVQNGELPKDLLFPVGTTTAVAVARIAVSEPTKVNVKFWPQYATCHVDGHRVGASLSKRNNLWIGTLLPGEHEFRLEVRAGDFRGYWKDSASIVMSSDREIGKVSPCAEK